MSLWIFKIPMASALNIPMTAIREYSKYPWHEYSKYPWRQLLNIQNTDDVSIKLPHEYSNYPWGHFMNNHDVTSWVFKIPITSLHEFSHGDSFRIFKWPFWIFKIPMTSELSQSDVMANISNEAFWIFTKWRHWYFEYSQSDVMGIFKSWRHGYFGIFLKWCHGYFEYSKEVVHFLICDMDILNIHSDIGILNIQRSRVILNMNFKIPMTSASEYFHNVTSLFKIPMTSPHKYSKYP